MDKIEHLKLRKLPFISKVTTEIAVSYAKYMYMPRRILGIVTKKQ